MKRTWAWPAVYLLGGAAVATARFLDGSPVGAVVTLLLFLLLAAVFSPLAFPMSVGAAEARRRSAADGRPVVYWRPGCTYCLRLRLRLVGRARRLHWVNIWRDPEAAEAVRAVNDGNETVPTVVVGGRPHTNPAPTWVRRQLSAAGS
ncbi:hypothetical protein HUT13_20080 [Streptomyces harbinensis]|uniref:glutaredoxin domain-containing protein n=1 Tax=Streptomyces harbinensis TaxID=1176198 RepID=UPI0015919BCD|nr:glutaredoxin domain-containing protein [Streptomyces harbinensis]QKV70805.1 hypothetical protein HUT13_20080 [Streptomyces harbinensis]